MIRNLSELLQEIKSKGLDQISSKEKHIKHRPTIGNIFEGLTNEILTQSILPYLDLKVVNNSFIYDDKDFISNEIDCMIVIGEGEKVSFTNQYKYHISDVLAVIQVKKNLFSKDIDSAHWNLRSVNEMGTDDSRYKDYIFDLHVNAYELLTGKKFPTRVQVSGLSEIDKHLYYLLMMEATFPAKIVVAYYGFKSELHLRNGFVNELEKLSGDEVVHGYGPVSFPNLIICGESSIIKNNGMPNAVPIRYDEEFYWPILLSTNRRPFYYLLEIIWTRIVYKFELATNIFDSEYQNETVHPFLSCKSRQVQSFKGWDYYYHELSDAELRLKFTDEI